MTLQVNLSSLLPQDLLQALIPDILSIQISTMDFFEKGCACIDLIDPRFASDAWKDVDKNEILRHLDFVRDEPWKWKPLTCPNSSNFLNFVAEIDNVGATLRSMFEDADDQNMYKCWERFGKKHLKPPILMQELIVFQRTPPMDKMQDYKEYVWVLVPLIPVSEHEGLPILIEGTQRNLNRVNQEPFWATLQPGQALMFHARLKSIDPEAGGGVVFARAFDVTGM